MNSSSIKNEIPTISKHNSLTLVKNHSYHHSYHPCLLLVNPISSILKNPKTLSHKVFLHMNVSSLNFISFTPLHSTIMTSLFLVTSYVIMMNLNPWIGIVFPILSCAILSCLWIFLKKCWKKPYFLWVSTLGIWTQSILKDLEYWRWMCLLTQHQILVMMRMLLRPFPRCWRSLKWKMLILLFVQGNNVQFVWRNFVMDQKYHTLFVPSVCMFFMNIVLLGGLNNVAFTIVYILVQCVVLKFNDHFFR